MCIPPGKILGTPLVVDPHCFNADPDPAFFLIADPDPAFILIADPDPDPVLNPGF